MYVQNNILLTVRLCNVDINYCVCVIGSTRSNYNNVITVEILHTKNVNYIEKDRSCDTVILTDVMSSSENTWIYNDILSTLDQTNGM
jgi:hypothetical protein